MAEEFAYESYTVGLLCRLPSALCAARALLDEEHEPLPSKDGDDNSYFLGKMGKHNVVLVFPEPYGMNPVVPAVTSLIRTFPNIRFGLMVGLGGGVPKLPNSDPRQDIRLGDVVVSWATNKLGGVIQYDVVKVAGTTTNLKIKSRLKTPPRVLLKAIQRLNLDYRFGKGKMWTDIDQVVNMEVPELEDGGYPGQEHDQLFKFDYQHSSGENCSSCDVNQTENRGVRKSTRSVVHHGLIASGNQSMRSSVQRDQMRDSWGVSCFEWEAAGLMDTFPCIFIRGICNYSDSHRYEIWRPYAAIAAAAYTKDLLRSIHPQEVEAILLPKITEPPTASQANGATQAMGNGAGVGSSLGADRPQVKKENKQADVKILRAESI
ncbi:nucleoside phosphorylase domain-containing protein [Trichoderma afarasin]